MRKLNPEAGRTNLRKLAPHIYSWLYRNDHAWLMQNSPLPQTVNKPRKARVDWEERDQEIGRAVLNATKMLREKKPLVRITMSSLGKYTGYLSIFQQHLGKLPRTTAILGWLQESITQFQDRRILMTIQRLAEIGIKPVSWRVMKLAGLKKVCEDRVKDIIHWNDLNPSGLYNFELSFIYQDD